MSERERAIRGKRERFLKVVKFSYPKGRDVVQKAFMVKGTT